MAKRFNAIGWLGGAQKSSLRVMVWLSRKSTRWWLFILILGLAVWQGYINVWMPLKQEVSLPVGVLEENPQLDVDVLRSINNQRNSRLTEERPSFRAFRQFFKAPPGENKDI